MFRIVRGIRFGLRYYKEIAKLMGIPVLPINDQLPSSGQCLLYDEHKNNPKMMEMDAAKQVAKAKKLDLVLMREGNPPSIQLSPYTYNIYKEFQKKIRPASLIKQLKSIQISRRIQQHDLQTKKMIVQRLLKKGYTSFRLVATDNTEQNRLLLQKFCQMMQWKDNYTYQLVSRQIGKGQFQYWVCFIHIKNAMHPISMERLDKKYERMERKARGTGKKIDIESQVAMKEQSQSEEETKNTFNSKYEIMDQLFGKGLDRQMQKMKKQPKQPILTEDPLKMRPERLNSQEIRHQVDILQKKGKMMSGLDLKRLRELKKALNERDRFGV